MKNKYFIIIALFGCIAGFSASSSANIMSDMLKTLQDTKVSICEKANFWKANFSIRSGKGIACKNKFVAAFSELVCPKLGAEGYENSHCHKNALIALDGEEPLKMLGSQLKKQGKKALTITCKYLNNVSKLRTIADKVCPSED
jgi:hypothetical protein